MQLINQTKYSKPRHTFAYFLLAIFFALPIYAQAQTNFNTALFDLYNQAKGSTTLQDLPHSSENGGLYMNIYQLSQQNDIITQNETINATLKTLHQTYDCTQVQATDIQNILLNTNANFTNEVPHLIKQQVKDRSRKKNTSLASSCLNVINCIASGDVQTIGKKDISFCTQTINDIYDIVKQYAQLVQPMSQQSYGSQRYENGTLDDSSFDLLVDIEAIGNILFSNNKPTPQTYFFEFPQTKNIGQSTNPLLKKNIEDDPKKDPDPSAPSTLSPILPPQPTDEQFPYDDPHYRNQYTELWTPLKTGSQNDKEIANNGIVNPQGTNNIPLFGNNFCFTWLTIPPEEKTNPKIRQEYQEEMENYLDSFDTQQLINDILIQQWWSGSNQYTWWSNNTGDKKWEIDDDQKLPDKPQETKETLNCLQQCDQNLQEQKNLCEEGNKKLCLYQATSDHLICKIQCLCGITPKADQEEEWMEKLVQRRVRYCMVPTKQVVVFDRATVMSIEEIIDQINNVLLALKQSGQLTKRTYTTEYMESSLQKTKLKDLFAFTISVNFKPVFNSISDRFIKEKNQKQYEQRASYKDPQRLNLDKNMVMQNNLADIISKSITLSPQDYQQQLNKLEQMQQHFNTGAIDGILTKLKQANIAHISQSSKDFIIDNIVFREKTTAILQNRRNITLSLKTKIEKWK